MGGSPRSNCATSASKIRRNAARRPSGAQTTSGPVCSGEGALARGTRRVAAESVRRECEMPSVARSRALRQAMLEVSRHSRSEPVARPGTRPNLGQRQLVRWYQKEWNLDRPQTHALLTVALPLRPTADCTYRRSPIIEHVGRAGPFPYDLFHANLLWPKAFRVLAR